MALLTEMLLVSGVALDLVGFRSGAMNEVLPTPTLRNGSG